MLAGAIALSRALVEFYYSGNRLLAPLPLAAIVVLAVALAHAVGNNWSFRPADADRGSSVIQWERCVWIGLLILAIAVWPAAFDPYCFSLAVLFVFGSMALFPVVLIETRGPSGRSIPGLNRYRTSMVTAAVGLSIWSVIVYMAASCRSVGSVDFFYYLCSARDMVRGDVAVSDNAYCYFPGVYLFWRWVMHLAGTSLTWMQSVALGLIVANAAAVLAIVRRMTGRWLIGLVASLWYLVMSFRFEGIAGVTEPLATLPVLLALAVWGGQGLKGGNGWWNAFVLGIAFGTAVLVKQQGGLLAVGAVSLLLCRSMGEPSHRHRWPQLFVIPVVALMVFCAGVLLEGRGWVPLQQGLQMASGYGREGTILGNLYTQIRGDESAFLGIGIAILVAGVTFFRKEHRDHLSNPQWQIVIYCMVTFGFTLIQFGSRPFGHYMLLGAPWLVIATVVLFATWWRRLAERCRWRYLFEFLTLLFVAIPFASTAGRQNTLYVWRPVLSESFEAQDAWHRRPALQVDLSKVREWIPPGSPLFVAPARRNSIYYLLDAHTANPDGYWFFLPDFRVMPWHRCDFVILLTENLDANDYQFCSLADRDALRGQLIERGFRRVGTDCSTLEVWQNPKRKTER